jgi:hypothetical protein
MDTNEISKAENKIQGLAFVNITIIHGVPRRKENMLNVPSDYQLLVLVVAVM